MEYDQKSAIKKSLDYKSSTSDMKNGVRDALDKLFQSSGRQGGRESANDITDSDLD